MALSFDTKNRLALALTSTAAANEIVGELLGGNEASPPAAPSNVAVTFTAGGTPAAYTTPTGALTIANSGTPTVVELLAYCDELRGVLTHVLSVLHSQGITT